MAVIGCGGVGLSVIQGAILAGALRVIAIDQVETKLAMATQFGATDVVDASSGDVVEKIRDLTNGGVDYSFEGHRGQGDGRTGFQHAPGGGELPRLSA